MPCNTTPNTILVILSHGLESGPMATKIQAMKSVAEEFPAMLPVVMDYRGMNRPDDRLAHLRTTLHNLDSLPDRTILAGSSLGGWVSAAASSSEVMLGCFLLAPALGLSHYTEPYPRIRAKHVHIVHGWQDDVVPPGPVITQAQEQRLSLRLVNDGHRLANSLDILLSDFRVFLSACRATTLKTGYGS